MARTSKTGTALEQGFNLISTANNQAEALQQTLALVAAQLGNDDRLKADAISLLAMMNNLTEAIVDLGFHAELALDETPES